MLLVDAGTSYIKILDLRTKNLSIIPLNDYEKISNLEIVLATGHNACLFPKAKSVNELVALAKGAEHLCSEKDFTLLDVGSRDMKIINFNDGEFEKCEWNTSCGAMIGLTIELMCRYFNRLPKDLKPSNKSFEVTCGLLGITKFFDSVSGTTSIDEALSSLINGMAKFAWQFSGQPKKIYLSGGLCENEIFINCFKKLCPDLKVVGRFISLNGLSKLYQNKAYTLEKIASTI